MSLRDILVISFISLCLFAQGCRSTDGQIKKADKDAADIIGQYQKEALGKTEKFVSELMNGKAPITPETAIHLERVLGSPASYWNSRESAYREWLARQSEAQELGAQVEWAANFPLTQMVELGWLAQPRDPSEKAGALLDYFGIATPKEWHAVWGDALPQVAFRQSTSYEVDRYALSAWLRRGEAAAQEMKCSPFDRQAFEAALVQARALTTEAPAVFQPELTAACCATGVALVFTPDLPRTRVSAAVRWIKIGRAHV